MTWHIQQINITTTYRNRIKTVYAGRMSLTFYNIMLHVYNIRPLTYHFAKWALNYTTILHNLDTYNKKKQAKQVEVGMLKMRLRVMYEYWQSGFVQNVYVSYCGIQGQILLLAELFMSKIFYFRYFLNTFETIIFSIKINLWSKHLRKIYRIYTYTSFFR